MKTTSERDYELRAAFLRAKEYAGCGDNSCMFRRPKGMATNGGCRCLGRDGSHTPGLPTSLARLYKAVAEVLDEQP